jgi:hypothetical protein
MLYVRRISENDHNLAAIIDPLGIGKDGAGNIDLGKGAAIQQVTMDCAVGVLDSTYDLATVIDPLSIRNRTAWEIDLGEGRFILMAAALLFAAGFLVCKGDGCGNQQAESACKGNKRFAERRAPASEHTFHGVSSFNQ